MSLIGKIKREKKEEKGRRVKKGEGETWQGGGRRRVAEAVLRRKGARRAQEPSR